MMEKVIFVRSWVVRNGKTWNFERMNDGLEEVNSFLEKGWKVKDIVTCSAGDDSNGCYAYVVIEKEE